MHKRILHILILALAAAGCVKEPSLEGSGEKGIFISQPINVGFSVNVPEPTATTKALGENPDIRSLHVAVFNEDGYLSEYTAATFDKATANNTCYKYNVTLTTSEKARTLHFIANGPSSLKYGSETNIIRALVSDSLKDAYWQRVRLDDIRPEDSTKPVSEWKLEPISKAKLDSIKLVRNFTKVTVTANHLKKTAEDTSVVSNFKLVSFRLMNIPQSGAIAPYSRANSDFIDNYQGYANPAALSLAGYEGYEPIDTKIDTGMGDIIQVDTTGGDGKYSDNSAYLYEREADSQTPTYILVGGYYYKNGVKSSKLRYYKVSLRDDDNNAIALLRNFNYKINILQVLTDGCDTWEQAMATIGSGEISTSVEAEHLTNVSNGRGRIFVEYTSKTLVTGGSVTLKYKFLPDESNGLIVNNDVAVTKGEGNFIESFSVAATDDADKFRTITLNITEPTASKQTQNMVIVGTDADGNYVQRKVTFVLMPKQELLVDCIPEFVTDTTGAEVKVQIRIPGGLPSSMFPLYMNIEASENTLTTNNAHQLPVRTGKSICPDKNKRPAFYYLRTITYDEYTTQTQNNMDEDGNVAFLSWFKTNTAESASYVCVSNEYFTYFADSATDYSSRDRHHSWDRFYNYTGGQFTNLTFNPTLLPVAESQNFTFSFALACNDEEIPKTISITLDGAYADYTDTSKNPHLTYKGNNEYEYDTQYSGFSKNSIVLNLKTSSVASTATVSLSADLFTDASKTATPKLAIPTKVLDLTGEISAGAQVYVFDHQPGMSDIDNGKTKSMFTTAFTASEDGTHLYLPEIDFTGKSVTSETKLWFAYKSTSGYYYIANYDAGGDKLYDILALTENWKYKLNFTNNVPKETATLEIEDFTLKVKESGNVTYKYNGTSKTSGEDIEFTPVSSDIASITKNANGTYTIKALKAGSVNFHAVIAETGSYTQAECDFTVTVKRKGRKMEIAEVTMLSAATATPSVTLKDENNGDITSTALDSVIAYSYTPTSGDGFKIESSTSAKEGLITSDWGAQSYTVIATLPESDEYEASIDTFTVKVNKRDYKITLNYSGTLQMTSNGSTAQIEVNNRTDSTTIGNRSDRIISYKSDNDDVCTVSTSGLITAGATGGHTTVTVKGAGDNYYNNAQATFTVSRVHWVQITDISKMTSGSVYMLTNTESTYAASNSSTSAVSLGSFNAENEYNDYKLTFNSTGTTNVYNIIGSDSKKLVISVWLTDASLSYSSSGTQNWTLAKDTSGIYISSKYKPYLRTYTYTINISGTTFDVSNLDLGASKTYLNIYKYNE